MVGDMPDDVEDQARSRARLRKPGLLLAAGLLAAGLVAAGVVAVADDELLPGDAGGGSEGSGRETAEARGSSSGLPTVAIPPRNPLEGTSPDKSSPNGPGPRLPGAAAEAARPRAEAVPLNRASAASSTVSVEVAGLEWVQGETVIPGEVGGNSLRVTVKATNSGQRPVVLSGSVVNMYYGPDRKPSSFLLQPGSDPFPGRIGPGESVQGVFVFTMPRRPGLSILVEADLDDDLRIVFFRGKPSDLL